MSLHLEAVAQQVLARLGHLRMIAVNTPWPVLNDDYKEAERLGRVLDRVQQKLKGEKRNDDR